MRKYYLILILFLTLILSGCYNKGNEDLKKALLNISNYSYALTLSNDERTITASYMFDNNYVRKTDSNATYIYNSKEDYIICEPSDAPAFIIESWIPNYPGYRSDYLRFCYIMDYQQSD